MRALPGTALVGFALGLLETGSYPVGIGLTMSARQLKSTGSAFISRSIKRQIGKKRAS
jgi:hypothetical protein